MAQAYDNYDEIAEEVFGPIYADIASRMIERTGKRTGRLLDVGCGGGHMGLAVMALGNFSEGTFCDIRPETEALVTARAEAAGLGGRARHVVCDVHRLPFPDGSFDLVVSRGSMPFWNDQRAAFRELYRVLAPGGWAYVGGGLGGREHRERIQAMMNERTGGCPCCDRKNSLALKTEEYAALFAELGCPWRAVENSDEGRWFLFGKEEVK